MNDPVPTLKRSIDRLKELVRRHDLNDAHVSITATPLSPNEAIGRPSRKDFPILAGVEKVIEACFCDSKGHAYTDSPDNFTGTLKEVLDLPLNTNRNRAVTVATMNAVLRNLDMTDGTVHCRNEEPERCAREIAGYVLKKWGKTRVGLIGLNPAIAEELIVTFGDERVRVTDLNPRNIHSMKFGVQVWDGHSMTDTLIRESIIILITGTTIVNNTFHPIWKSIHHHKRDFMLYGVTAAGFCTLTELHRICPYGR
jgi:uncharacterized protein (DUF4213/DUF364 family)